MTNELMSKRERKALRGISRNKFNDFGGVCILADKGYITMEGPSDDIDIQITDKGHAALKALEGNDEHR